MLLLFVICYLLWYLLLDVKLVEVRLDGAVRENFIILESKNRAHVCIRVDGMLLSLKAIGINVHLEGLGDFSGSHLGALLLSKEDSKGVLEEVRGSEDRRVAGLFGLTIILLYTAAALGLLHFTRVLLLKLAKSGDGLAGSITDRGKLLNHGLNLFSNRYNRGGGSSLYRGRSRRNGCRGSRGGYNRGSSDGGLSGLLGGSRSNGLSSYNSYDGFGLLCNSLGGSLGSLAHCISYGGSI